MLFGSIFNLANVRGYIQIRHVEPIDLNYEKINIVTVAVNQQIAANLDFEVTVTSDLKSSNTEGSLSYYF